MKKEDCDSMHQILGTVTLNEKGQIVIPADVRKRMGIKAGDQLMLIAKGDLALGLVKTSNLKDLIQTLQNEIKHVKQGS